MPDVKNRTGYGAHLPTDHGSFFPSLVMLNRGRQTLQNTATPVLSRFFYSQSGLLMVRPLASSKADFPQHFGGMSGVLNLVLMILAPQSGRPPVARRSAAVI